MTRRLTLLFMVAEQRKQEERVMAKFIIQPHGRLNDWVADERGYFREAGLEY
jgi:hypothetical protein